MVARIKKWGNSQGVRFSKEILSRAGMELDDEIDIEVEYDRIIITKVKKNEIILRELFEEYKGNYKPKEIDWGKPEGDEEW